jgi:hypothetical protein
MYGRAGSLGHLTEDVVLRRPYQAAASISELERRAELVGRRALRNTGPQT